MTASASAGARVVVVGVGNPWRGDDGAGPAVATAFGRHVAADRRAGRIRDGDDPRHDRRPTERDAAPANDERHAGHLHDGHDPRHDRRPTERDAAPANDERHAGHEGDGVEVLVLDGEPARLVEAWDGADLAVVVDAVRTGARPGTLHRLDVAGHHDGGTAGPALTATRRAGGTAGSARLDGPTHHGASSHGLGIAQAVELGRVLGRLPSRLVVVGIEGADFEPGNDLTAGVAAAVEPAARLVAELIGLDHPVRRRTREAG